MLDGFCNARVYKRECMYEISVCGVIAAKSESREHGKPSMERRGGTGAPRHKQAHAIEVTWVTQRGERAGSPAVPSVKTGLDTGTCGGAQPLYGGALRGPGILRRILTRCI
jgi:hypothetical protein